MGRHVSWLQLSVAFNASITCHREAWAPQFPGVVAEQGQSCALLSSVLRTSKVGITPGCGSVAESRGMCDRCAIIPRGVRSAIVRMGGRSAIAEMGGRRAIVITPLGSRGVIVRRGDRSAIDQLGGRSAIIMRGGRSAISLKGAGKGP